MTQNQRLFLSTGKDPGKPILRLSRLVFFALSLVPFVWLIVTGLIGLDFGYHWDENVQFEVVRQSIEELVLLPRWYKYPSMTYWLNVSGLVPYLLLALARKGMVDWHVYQFHLMTVTGTPNFHLRVRGLFLFVSALAVLWTSYQPAAAGRRRWEGLAAGAILGFSWEIAYHARWVAPDVILAQFGGLVLLCTTLAIYRPGSRLWLPAAAVAAGLGAGTKYPGGLLIIPVLIAAYRLQSADRSTLRRAWSALWPVILIFLAGYLVSTPGTILDPVEFVKDVNYEITHYGTGWFDKTVPAGLPHLGLNLMYLGLVLFSHYPPLALFFSVLTLVGAYSLMRTSKWEAALLLAFPLVYLVYFSLQSVMVVRNLLVVAPFLAVLSARGAGYVIERLPRPAFRWAFAGLVALFLAVNAAWLWSAARSIQFRSQARFGQELIDYAQAHPRTQIAASDLVWQALANAQEKPPANLTHLPAPVEGMIAFYASEGLDDPRGWPDKRPGLASRYFGPWEVNFDYYSLWAGEDRILLMPVERAGEIGVKLVGK